jgi:hypothetical protein
MLQNGHREFTAPQNRPTQQAVFIIVKLTALSTISKHRVMAMQIVMINLNVSQSMK